MKNKQIEEIRETLNSVNLLTQTKRLSHDERTRQDQRLEVAKVQALTVIAEMLENIYNNMPSTTALSPKAVAATKSTTPKKTSQFPKRTTVKKTEEKDDNKSESSD